MFEKIKKAFSRYREQALYLLFGGLTTLVDWSISFFLYYFWGQQIEANNLLIHAANLIAWVAAVLFAFFTNRQIVFQSTRRDFLHVFGELGAFAGGRVLTLLLQEGIFLVCFDVLAWNQYAVKLIAAVLVIILNYLISKLLIFKNAQK